MCSFSSSSCPGGTNENGLRSTDLDLTCLMALLASAVMDTMVSSKAGLSWVIRPVSSTTVEWRRSPPRQFERRAPAVRKEEVLLPPGEGVAITETSPEEEPTRNFIMVEDLLSHSVSYTF